MTIFRKILAFILGHRAQIEVIAQQVFDKLGGDILTISADERRNRIVALTKSFIATRYPEFAGYSDVVIDLVVAKVRDVLRGHP